MTLSALWRDFPVGPELLEARSDAEFMALLPDLLTAGLGTPPVECRARALLLMRHYGLGALPPESVAEIARRDGLDPERVRRDLRAAKAALRRGLAETSRINAHLAHAERLRETAQEVLALLWQLPPESLPEGLRVPLGRLSVLTHLPPSEHPKEPWHGAEAV